MNKKFVGAGHEFHNKEFALGWAKKFVPTIDRVRLFDLIFSQLKTVVPNDGNIVELGIGPGYLANYLLERMPNVSYYGIDFSLPMLEIAQERLKKYSPRVIYTQLDLVKNSWENSLSKPIHAIVSTWSLHDLGSPENINMVYRRSYNSLVHNGILINGDFIKPVGALQEYEGGRFYVAKHLELLKGVGFSNAKYLSLFEEELESPTPAQNYACIIAEK